MNNNPLNALIPKLVIKPGDQLKAQQSKRLEWIEELSRKDQAKVSNMPARNAYRVSLAMEHKNKLLPNIIDVQSIL